MGDEEKKRCCEGWVGQYMFSPNRKRGGGVSMKNNNTPLHSHNTPTLSFHPPPPSEHAASGHPNAVGPIHASQTKHKRDGTLGDTDHDDRHALRGGVSTVSARPPSPPPTAMLHHVHCGLLRLPASCHFFCPTCGLSFPFIISPSLFHFKAIVRVVHSRPLPASLTHMYTHWFPCSITPEQWLASWSPKDTSHVFFWMIGSCPH